MLAIDNTLVFLIKTLFDLAIFVLLVRFLLAAVRVDYYNPVSQVIIKLTQPLVRPIRRVIPSYRTFELATLLLVVVFELLKLFLLGMIAGVFPNIGGLLLVVLAEIGKSIITIYFYAILLQAILSWVQSHSPAERVLYQLTSPIMRPIHRVIPPIGGIDISPIFALILLQVCSMLLISPLFLMGWEMAFG